MLSLKHSWMHVIRNVWKNSMFNQYILTVCLLWNLNSCSELSKNIEVVRGADVILYCSLNGTFTMPQWEGPPLESNYTNQDNPRLNPAILSVQEQRIDWLNNDYVNLIIRNVSYNEAGTYACMYVGHDTYRFNLTVIEPVVTSNSVPIITTQHGNFTTQPLQPVWPIPVAICIWMVTCTLLLCAVWRTSIKNFKFPKSIQSVLLIASCFLVIGWCYVIWRIYQTCGNPWTNGTPKEMVKLINADKIPAARFIQDSKPNKIKKIGYMSIYSLQCTQTRNGQGEINEYVIGSLPDTGNRGKTLMLVGAANTGKRTLIDGIVNYIMDVQCQHPFRLTFFEDKFITRKVRNGSGWIAHYTINPEYSRLDYPLHIIDTKGHENTTDAPEQQEKELIRNFLSRENNEDDKHSIVIDALCLLLRASDTDLTNQYEYFSSILELPEIKSQNARICYLTTYAHSLNPDDSQAGRALSGIRCVHGINFAFNNAILYEDNTKTADADRSVRWNMFKRSFEMFFHFLDNAEGI